MNDDDPIFPDNFDNTVLVMTAMIFTLIGFIIGSSLYDIITGP